MERSDGELVERVLSRGDESAFRELYRRHSPVLFRLAVRLLGGSDPDAGDVLQEAWCRAFEGLRRFSGGSSLRTWLAGVVVNCSREHIRARAQICGSYWHCEALRDMERLAVVKALIRLGRG